jgi:hypothetical protein
MLERFTSEGSNLSGHVRVIYVRVVHVTVDSCQSGQTRVVKSEGHVRVVHVRVVHVRVAHVKVDKPKWTNPSGRCQSGQARVVHVRVVKPEWSMSEWPCQSGPC